MRKTQYNFVLNYRPLEKGDSLEKGSLMHDMLEVHYSQQLQKFTSDRWIELMKAGFTPKSDAADAGFYFAAKMNLPTEITEEVVYQFREYREYYKHDSWNPLAVEEVGSKLLFENEDLKIIYNFKIDLICEQGNVIAPFDHKTSSQTREPSSMSNQFIAYCWGLGLNNIVINKIGFQKTLTPAKRFMRYILTLDNERIREWVNNSIWWLLQYDQHLLNNHFPMNLTSCDKYGACIYRPVCELNPLSRQARLERDFNPGENWDVAKILEAKE